jgi:hypothetical protein
MSSVAVIRDLVREGLRVRIGFLDDLRPSGQLTVTET